MSRGDGADSPDEQIRKGPSGLTAAQRRVQQDAAAGGSDQRLIRKSDGTIGTASIAFRSKRHRLYAYLRWAEGVKTHERYVGSIEAESRMEALKEAWRQVLENRLLEPPGNRSN